MLFPLLKLGLDTSVETILGITHVADRSVYFSSEEDILSIRRTADAYVKNKRKPVAFHEKSFRRHGKADLDELRTSLLKQDKERLFTFYLFLDTKIHQKIM